jgi:hypothetical protein
MENHRSTVNQRLYFAQLHLQWLSRELQNGQLPAMLVEQALGESLLFHLQRSYRAYLLEVAQTYGLYPASLDDATSFKALLDAEGKSSAEANELCALESSDSWLSMMLSESTSALLPGNTTPATATIALTQLDVVKVTDFRDSGQQYLDKLTALIESQRGQLEEW